MEVGHYRDDKRKPILLRCPLCGSHYTTKRAHYSLRLALGQIVCPYPQCHGVFPRPIPNTTPNVFPITRL